MNPLFLGILCLSIHSSIHLNLIPMSCLIFSVPFVPTVLTVFGDWADRATNASTARWWCIRSATNWPKSPADRHYRWASFTVVMEILVIQHDLDTNIHSHNNFFNYTSIFTSRSSEDLMLERFDQRVQDLIFDSVFKKFQFIFKFCISRRWCPP